MFDILLGLAERGRHTPASKTWRVNSIALNGVNIPPGSIPTKTTDPRTRSNQMPDQCRVLFITNTPAIYKAPAFRLLMELRPTQFVFFSRGGERYRSPSSDAHPEGLDYVDIATGAGRTRVLGKLAARILRSRFDVMIKCINGRFELPLSYVLCRLRRRRFVLWMGIWHWPKSPIHIFLRPFVLIMLRRADAVVTYGKHISSFVIGSGVSPERVFTAPQGIAPGGVFRPPAANYPREDHLRLLFVGRLSREKGVHILIEALSKCGFPYRLTVAGGGPELPRLRQLALQKGVVVNWRGAVAREELPTLYWSHDCVVMPSVTTRMDKEPWGYVANEAMLCGCLTLVSNGVGAAAGGLVRPDDTGLVFEEGDAEELVRQLHVVWSQPKRCQAIAARGQREASNFRDHDMAEGFVRAIDFVMAKKS